MSRLTQQGNPVAATWLMRTLTEVVRDYTRVDDCVLVLAAMEALACDLPQDCLADLRESAESLGRLGRSVEYRVVDPAARGDSPVGDQNAGVGSQHGPAAVRQETSGVLHRTAEGRVGPDANCPHLFDVVIAFLGPRPPGWIAAAPWSRLLAPGGLVAVVIPQERLWDAVGDLRHLLTSKTDETLLFFDAATVPAGPTAPKPFRTSDRADLLLFIPPLPMPPEFEAAE